MEINQVNQNQLELINEKELMLAIDTAKKYPRDLATALKNITFIACQDKDTAEACFYAVPRDGKRIIGASVRFAEIVSTFWGNMRSGARIVSNDGKTITAHGYCHDLETNTFVTIPVQNRLTDKNGKLYSEDMQIIMANRACAIAWRNVIFKVIPLAVTAKIQEKIKAVIIGDIKDIEETKKKALQHFISQGIKIDQIISVLGRDNANAITADDIIVLRGIATAIQDGDTTIHQAFGGQPSITKKKGTDRFSNLGKSNESESSQTDNNNLPQENEDISVNDPTAKEV